MEQQPPSNPDLNIKPNSAISIVESDPAFDSSGNPFNLPRDVLGIKCMLQRDYDGLKKVISAEQNPKGSIYALQGFRCPDKQETVLHTALQVHRNRSRGTSLQKDKVCFLRRIGLEGQSRTDAEKILALYFPDFNFVMLSGKIIKSKNFDSTFL